MEAQPQPQGRRALAITTATATAANLLSPMVETTHLWRQILKYSKTLETTPSWEEKAFAEDTAAVLGGSVWPPRSYSCNFCMREFRSAQALGGHMNVHRRDRARLQNHTTNTNSNPPFFKHPPRVFIKPSHYHFNSLKNNTNTSHSGKKPKLSLPSSSMEELDLELRLGDPYSSRV